MSGSRIIILYKDKSYDIIKEKDFRRVFNMDNIQCILFPDLYHQNVYYPIMPNNYLMSTNFDINIIFDIGYYNYETGEFTFLDRFSSQHQTNSIVEFIEYLSILYKLNGISSTIENINDGMINNTMEFGSIYPVRYKIIFDYGAHIIDSGILESQDYSGEMNVPFGWIVDAYRLKAISDIIYTIDSNSKLPTFIKIGGNKWKASKRQYGISDLNLNLADMVLVKMQDFNTYYLSTYEECNDIMYKEAFKIDIIVCEPSQITSKIYLNFANRIYNCNEIERDGLCNYIINETCWPFAETAILADLYSFIIWKTYAKDIINYLLAIYKNCVDFPLILIRHLGKLYNNVFTYDDIQNGSFTKYLEDYIN